MATVILLIIAAACFGLDAVGVTAGRLGLTPLGLCLIAVVLTISAWPATT